jgi:hypothetical protein
MRSSMALRSVHFGVRSWKLSNIGQWWMGDQKLLSQAPPCFERHVKARLHLQSLAPTPRYRVVCYDPFSLCVIHKEGLCPSSRDINRLMMMMKEYSFMHYNSDPPRLRTGATLILKRFSSILWMLYTYKPSAWITVSIQKDRIKIRLVLLKI